MVDSKTEVRNRTLQARIDYNGSVRGRVLQSEVYVILRAKVSTSTGDTVEVEN
jgi:hypothetical protein